MSLRKAETKQVCVLPRLLYQRPRLPIIIHRRADDSPSWRVKERSSTGPTFYGSHKLRGCTSDSNNTRWNLVRVSINIGEAGIQGAKNEKKKKRKTQSARSIYGRPREPTDFSTISRSRLRCHARAYTGSGISSDTPGHFHPGSGT